LTYTIALANQKGGVGKTTTALNLGVALATRGRPVLLLDLDPQANLTTGLGLDQSPPTMCQVLVERSISLEQAARPVEGVRLVPGDIMLSEADLGIVPIPGGLSGLRGVLLRAGDTLCIVDCPPNLGALTGNALFAADLVLIPVPGHPWALAGLERLLALAGQAPRPPAVRALRAFVDRTRLGRDVATKLAALGVPILQTSIRRSQALAAASGAGQSILRYAPESVGATDYQALAHEIEEVINGPSKNPTTTDEPRRGARRRRASG